MDGSNTPDADLLCMGSQRVLIVDDEMDILESLQILLESSMEGVEVKVAPSGEEGLEVLQEGVDLVISDFKMPGMDGLEFLRKVRKQRPDVPRILMTAFPDLQIAVDAINEARIETFFTKPLDPTEVVDVISAALRRRQEDRTRSQAFARAMEQARKKKEADE